MLRSQVPNCKILILKSKLWKLLTYSGTIYSLKSPYFDLPYTLSKFIFWGHNVFYWHFPLCFILLFVLYHLETGFLFSTYSQVILIQNKACRTKKIKYYLELVLTYHFCKLRRWLHKRCILQFQLFETGENCKILSWFHLGIINW